MAAAYSITCTAVTPTNDWITDRRPTEADGDSDGDVKARRNPDDSDYSYLHWSYVSEATPWKHSADWQPTATPEPAPTKPALAVGQRWRRRDGAVVRIFRRGDFFCADRFNYDLDGTAPFSSGPRPEFDLVELLPTEPTPTPRKFKETPRRTVTDFGHVIDAIDEDGVAWWMITSPDGPEPKWYRHPPLPAKEAAQ